MPSDEKTEPRSGWEFACQWYQEWEIARSIESSLSPHADPMDRFPTDVSTPEFAEWMTKQYRLAMAKGIQIGQGWSEAELTRLRTIEAKVKDFLTAVDRTDVANPGAARMSSIEVFYLRKLRELTGGE